MEMNHLGGCHGQPLVGPKGIATEDSLTRLWRWVRSLFCRCHRERHVVYQGLAIFSNQSIHTFLARNGDLSKILRQFDPRLPLPLHKLVHTPQGGLFLTRDKVCPYSVGCDSVTNALQLLQRIFVDVIAGHNRHIIPHAHASRFGQRLKRLLALVRQRGQISRIQSYPLGRVPEVDQRLGHTNEIGQSALQGIVCINETETSVGEGTRVRAEGGKFSIVGTWR
mmetsp:Transcript_50140/g.76248  ORF Transcript_50140/g.76248 Transcript_50140/m.76248 type:complete len:223 (+) Transcript_50140:357-1025(+)